MKKLATIIKAFDNYKLKEIDILNSADSKSRYTLLYRAMQEGSIKSDEDAARFIFGDKASPNDSKFRTFKKEFKNKVFNTLLFIDTTNDDFDDFQKIIFEANRQWLVIRNLYNNQLSVLASELAEELLTRVVKFEYFDLAMPIANYIKSGYSIIGDKEKHTKYQKLFEEYTEIWLAERKARGYHELLRLEQSNTSKFKPHISNLAQTYYKELEPLLNKYKSFSFQLNSRSVELYIFTSINDYIGQLDVAERALRFFDAKSVKSNLPLTIFLRQKMEALMYLKRYKEAEKTIEDTMKLRVKGTFNWYIGQESKVFLLFRMKRYTEAQDLYYNIIELPNFKSLLKAANLEIWELFNAYFYLLHKTGKAPELEFKNSKPDFKIKKFLNETPTFESDKKGMQLAILIVQICFMIINNEMDKISDKIEAIKKYLVRYTEKKDPTYRFQQFAKLLLEIPKLEYSKHLFEKNTRKILKNINSVATPVTENIFRAEVIELEELWVLMIDYIKSHPEINLVKFNKAQVKANSKKA